MIDLCEKPFIMDFDIKEEEILDGTIKKRQLTPPYE